MRAVPPFAASVDQALKSGRVESLAEVSSGVDKVGIGISSAGLVW